MLNNHEKMLQQMKTGQGFIAALDQSGGSTPKALKNYGIDESQYSSEEEMFDLVHQMRTRIITSPAFTNEHILGAILFERTMLSKIEDRFTAEYLWEVKHIVPFLKVDRGLSPASNGVQLMNPIIDLSKELVEAKKHNVFGTKMRSVIHNANKIGIEQVVDQQFAIARGIAAAGLVPIIEPEVSIAAPDKAEAEDMLKGQVVQHLGKWDPDQPLMFKFTIPTKADLYADLYDYSAVVRIVALSGGYSVDEACDKLAENHNMPASFSRALLQNLRADQTDTQFNAELKKAINKIYRASVN